MIYISYLLLYCVYFHRFLCTERFKTVIENHVDERANGIIISLKGLYLSEQYL